MGGPQGRVRRVRKISPPPPRPPRFETGTFKHVASRCTTDAILATRVSTVLEIIKEVWKNTQTAAVLIRASRYLLILNFRSSAPISDSPPPPIGNRILMLKKMGWGGGGGAELGHLISKTFGGTMIQLSSETDIRNLISEQEYGI
jgi:hypothetical protein